MAGDLHTHTTFSDGSTPMEEMPRLAAAAGLRWLAVSDHDSLLCLQYARQHPQQDGVTLIPATELSAFDFERGRRVHILCFYPQLCPALKEHCRFMAEGRNAAVLQSCRELSEFCPQFSTEKALEYARPGGVLYKAHVMRVLMDYGLADSVYGEVYHELFGEKPGQGKILHKPPYRTVEQVLDVIRAAGGVAVFAHPSVYQSMELVRRLAAQGAIDGVEIEHPRNTPQDKQELYRLAQEYDLIVTGGTDYHGMNSKRPHPVGTCRTSEENIARIQTLAQSRQKAL